MKIKGRYNIDINISTMFNNYKLILNEHNLVTNKGVEFIFNKILNNTDDYIEKIAIGYEKTKPTLTDTFDILKQPYMQKFDNVNITENEIHFELSMSGDKLNETSEIGLITNEKLLVTRDVHDTYDIPVTASVKIEYILSLTNIGENND